MLLGVVSDTHGRFDAALAPLFDGVSAIIHAGDIGKLEVIERLEKIAPVIAVEGNNDNFSLYPEEQVRELAGRRVLIRHIFGESQQIRRADREMIERIQPRIVVFGHSHRPYCGLLDDTMLFNPGSAGPRRFSLPRTAGLLDLNAAGIAWTIVDLDTGKTNKGERHDGTPARRMESQAQRGVG